MNTENVSPPAPPAPINPAEISARVLAAAPDKVPEPAPSVTHQDAGTPAPSAATQPTAAGKPTPGEIDAKGTPFDPAKHSGGKHGVTKTWLPKGGRKPATPAAPERPADPWSPEARAAAAPTPPAPAETVTPAAPAVGAQSQPAAAPAETKPAAPAEVEGLEYDPEAGADLTANGLYIVTGLVTGEAEEARQSGAEHAQLKKMLALYFKARGWHVKGGLAVIISVVAYVVRVCRKPKTEARLSAWYRDWRAKAKADAARPVEVTATPVSRPAAPAAVAPAAPARSADPFAHIRDI